MLFKGIIIPNENACGFVQPAFIQNDQTENELYFCITNSEHKIKEFVLLDREYNNIITPNISAIDTEEYNLNGPAPIAFFFKNNEKKIGLVGNKKNIILLSKYLFLCPFTPIETKYKVAQFLYKMNYYKNYSTLYVKVLDNYYSYLCNLDYDYAQEWKKDLSSFEGIEVEYSEVNTIKYEREMTIALKMFATENMVITEHLSKLNRLMCTDYNSRLRLNTMFFIQHSVIGTHRKRRGDKKDISAKQKAKV